MNKKEKIENTGIFKFIDTFKDGLGIRVSRNFLESIIIKISQNSIEHIDNVGYPPFIYREKQLHTVLAPAIAELTNNTFLMESPATRNWSARDDKQSDSHGWVDYWCLYKNYDYYIELKHGFISLKGEKLRDCVKQDWLKAFSQLEVLNDEIELQKQFSNKGIFKVILDFLPIYASSGNEDKLLTISNDLSLSFQEDIMKNIADGVSNIRANWSCLWIMDDDYKNEVYPFDHGFEKYPAVLFLAHVSELEK